MGRVGERGTRTGSRKKEQRGPATPSAPPRTPSDSGWKSCWVPLGKADPTPQRLRPHLLEREN